MSGRRYHTKSSKRLNGKAGGNGRSKRLRSEQRPSEQPSPRPSKPSTGHFDSGLLNIALEAAVTLRIQELRKRPVASVLNMKRLKELGDVIAERGDIIMFGSKKKSAAEDAFNKLAEALARLAFVQGGVTFNGVHYEARCGVA